MRARTSGSARSGYSGSSAAPSRLLDLIAFFTAGEDKPAQCVSTCAAG